MVDKCVYGRDNVNLAFSEDGPSSEMRELKNRCVEQKRNKI